MLLRTTMPKGVVESMIMLVLFCSQGAIQFMLLFVKVRFVCLLLTQGTVLASSAERGGIRVQFSRNPFGRKRDAAGGMVDYSHAGGGGGGGVPAVAVPPQQAAAAAALAASLAAAAPPTSGGA
jgi:hypothetical protein